MHRNTVISKVGIQNFKCHRVFNEELNGINILAGENASGKSSIIQAFLLFYFLKNGRKGTVHSTYKIMGYDIGVASDLVYQNAGSEEIRLDFIVNGDPIGFCIVPHENDDTLLKLTEVYSKNPKPKFKLFYINADRKGPQLADSISYEGWNRVGIHGENTAYVMNWLDKMMPMSEGKLSIAKKLQISRINRFSANCEEWLSIIVPGTKLETMSAPSLGIASIKYSNFGGTYYSPTATGFGISYVLPIIVQALIASMEQNAILIVENPEAHLHPYSQSMMGKFMAFVASSGVQVIVETHSEHFINGCRLQLAKNNECDLAKIFFFSKKEEVTHEEILLNSYGELSHWPKGFFDQDQTDLREILKLRLCQK